MRWMTQVLQSVLMLAMIAGTASGADADKAKKQAELRKAAQTMARPMPCRTYSLQRSPGRLIDVSDVSGRTLV